MAEIIGIVASLIAPTIQVGKWIAGPIKRRFNHLRSFEESIQSLTEEARKLRAASHELQMKVDAAKRNEEVEKLLENARNQEDITKEIENKIPNIQKGCLNLISRYSLSKKAKKTAEDLKELSNKLELSISAVDAPPAGVMDSLHYGQDDKEFESRKQIEERIMEALRDRNVNKIGICGMGGVGKTTMAERIMHKMGGKGENLFDKVLMVVVSQQVDIHAIQQQIAECLDLTLDVTNLSLRAEKIRERLANHSKRVFIVLDDVWKEVTLQDLGFPRGNTTSGRCTILLTSRNMNVLENMMHDQNIFKLKVLDGIESWSLFREKIGSCAEIEDLHAIAKDVAKECKGLPLALLTVGSSLRNKKDRGIWDDALRRLRNPNLVGIPPPLKDTYNQLRFSYDYLGKDDKHAQILFLLCSMFKEDYSIPLEILTWYGMGFNMLEGTKNLKEARNRICSLVDMLKDRCLLLEGVDKDSVKMHDVLRDMAIHIALEERHGFVVNLDGMSMDGASWEKYSHKDYWSCISMIFGNKNKFPMELEFLEELQLSRLRLLLLDGGDDYDDDEWSENDKESADGFMRLLDKLFDRMKGMIVLSLESTMIKSLPPRTTQFLKNLKTLRLSNCDLLETISVVGELSTLEILCCIDCQSITALPAELNGRLKLLRLLEIIDCLNLKTIAPGVISSLVLLEELRIQNSFDGWEAKEERNKKNAALVELDSLTNLTCLEIEIFGNPNLVAEEVSLSPNIVKYDIKFYRSFFPYGKDQVTKSITLRIQEEINVGNWIQKLIRSAEDLEIEFHGGGANKVNLMKLENIKYLTIRECSMVKKLVDTTISIPIESNNSFSLRHHFPMSMARNIFSQLEVLRIICCSKMEAIFHDDDDGKTQKDGESHDHLIPMVFPKLKELSLIDLPRLTTLCKGVQSIEFPKLTKMEISRLPKLTSLVGSLESHDLHVVAPRLEWLQLNKSDQDNYMCNMWGYQIPISFINNLEELDIGGLNDIINLMSSPIARNLVHLRRLMIRNCKEMLQVIGDDEEQAVGSELVPSLFPCLEQLCLMQLPKLRSFCQWKHPFELPSLLFFEFYDCPQMETFTKGSLNTPNLRRIRHNWMEIMVKLDVNEAIQQCLINLKDKGSTSAEPMEGGRREREGEGEIEEIQEEKIEKN